MLWHRPSSIIQPSESKAREKVLCLDRPTAIKIANKGSRAREDEPNLFSCLETTLAEEGIQNNSIMLSH
jgi:hypothetical protein